MAIQKGDVVRIWKNKIFKQMGFRFVTGEVFLVHEGGLTFAMRCHQTNAMELVIVADSSIEIITQLKPGRQPCPKRSQNVA